MILDTRTSTSPAVDVARELIEAPMVKIDDPMTERAVELADQTDVLVLAQASMSHLKAPLSDRVPVSVLSGPELAMERGAELAASTR